MNNQNNPSSITRHPSSIIRHSSFVILSFVIYLAITSCGRPSVPESATAVNAMPKIYPDYTEVTLPANICPPNFFVTDCEEAVARLSFGDQSFTYGQNTDIIIDESEWAALRDAAKGKAVQVEVFALDASGWKAYKPFNIHIAEEDIDPYISYRNIQPSYVGYENLYIRQRDITSFDESDIYNNRALNTEANGQCINCHSYQNYKTDRMLFHVRQNLGGTVIYDNGKLRKIDLKTDSTISAGVYPAWHPTQNIVAFSTNLTGQSFHTKDIRKIEVQDTESDLILYDVEKNEIHNISNLPDELEVFPTWSADGKTLYYCSAHFEYKDTTSHESEMIQRYAEVRYNLYAKPFDAATRKFGESRLIYDASSDSLSVTLPRVSPDGRWLVCSIGSFGCFHVWHPDADIVLFDLQQPKTENQKPKTLKPLNSPRSESYPSFSSNGRWIMAASRRDDGNYTRPVISYFDKQGKCHKSFAVPQRDPHHYQNFLYSYNRPEFMTEPVKTSVHDLLSIIKTDAEKAQFAE